MNTIQKQSKNSQIEYLNTFIQKYNKKTATSKKIAQQYRPIMADKTSIGLGFIPELKELCYPITVERSSGSRLWDIDGNEYIDILMGLGINLCGHNPQFIQDAIAQQLQRGIHIGVQKRDRRRSCSINL